MAPDHPGAPPRPRWPARLGWDHDAQGTHRSDPVGAWWIAAYQPGRPGVNLQPRSGAGKPTSTSVFVGRVFYYGNISINEAAPRRDVSNAGRGLLLI